MPVSTPSDNDVKKSATGTTIDGRDMRKRKRNEALKVLDKMMERHRSSDRSVVEELIAERRSEAALD